MKEEVTLFEILVKTSYLIQITEPDNLENLVSFGSGFIVEYDENKFFVTADHNLHFDDYGEVEKRTWKDYVISVFNNYTDPNNFLSTGITPLGGFYYGEKHDFVKPNEMPELVDVTVCKMKEINFRYPFLTDGVKFFNGEVINSGEEKFQINKECFGEAVNGINYFIFGKIKTKLIDNIRIEWKNTLKESLKFISKNGDYLLFNTPQIVKIEEWEGLSGSPVLSEDGYCVGVLCVVKENSNSIWVMPITEVKRLIEAIILQEKIEEDFKI